MLTLKRHRFISKLLETEHLTPTVKRFRFEAPDDFAYHAGMFMSVSFQAENGKWLGRSYSLASLPTQKGWIEFCIKKTASGVGTTLLFKMQPGKTIKMMGPMGQYFIPQEQLNKGFCFIATGTGIAPFRGMIRDLLQNRGFDKPLYLVTGVRYRDEIIYDASWKEFEKHYPSFKYHPHVSQPKGEKGDFQEGRVQTHLLEWLPSIDLNFYICGLKAMIEDVRRLLLENGVREEQLNIEQYD